jgi:asparagine synthase (glutamine-hydrolysing)
MCGIIGKVSPQPVERELLERMCGALAHRGPDSRGLFADDGVGLGIQRLRVIDLVTGDQPVHSEDGTVSVVLNGEIYNYRELREDLRGRGHVFATQGDTEVIVHLYEEYGRDCVDRLHGMFAFALWDARQRSLLLARDRMGKKPLFYAVRDGSLSFASELAALMEDRDLDRRIDPQAVDCFFAYGYVPAPLSIFQAVRKLPPAHTLVFEGGRVSIERYWQLDYSRKLEVDDPRELHEPLRNAIRAATRRRLISDVPLGAFLSGGVDSSAVVAAMAAETPDAVQTFSIGFDSDRFDELSHARRVAELFGTDHHEFVVRPAAIEIAPKMVRHYGEPFADSSAIPCFYLAELTRRHVTVALNGDGGDESFGGYTRYVANRFAERLDRVPHAIRRLVGASGQIRAKGDPASVSNKIRRLRGSLAMSPEDRYLRYVSWFDQVERNSLYSDDFLALLPAAGAAWAVHEPWRDASGSNVIDRMLEVDATTYLPGDLLPKIDIATMAYSLEARSPLLDHELMEFVASIPAEFKVRGRHKKWILREALREWLPSDILDRPKQGFMVPLSDWFRGELREHLREVLLDPGSINRDYFRPAVVTELLERHDRGADGAAKKLWSLYMFELWHREFVDVGRGAAGTATPSVLADAQPSAAIR